VCVVARGRHENPCAMVKCTTSILSEQDSIILYSLSIVQGGRGKGERKTHRQEFTAKGTIEYERMKTASYKLDLPTAIELLPPTD